MSTIKEMKEQKVNEIKDLISNSKSLVLVDYKGINVAEDTALRRKFRENDVEYKVLKNRLVKIAFNDLGMTEFDEALNGTTAIAFAKGDQMLACKIVVDSSKEIKSIEPKCGLFEGKFIDKDGVIAISAIPSKEVLLAQLCGLLQSGLSGLARAVSQIAEQKAE